MKKRRWGRKGNVKHHNHTIFNCYNKYVGNVKLFNLNIAMSKKKDGGVTFLIGLVKRPPPSSKHSSNIKKHFKLINNL